MLYVCVVRVRVCVCMRACVRVWEPYVPNLIQNSTNNPNYGDNISNTVWLPSDEQIDVDKKHYKDTFRYNNVQNDASETTLLVTRCNNLTFSCYLCLKKFVYLNMLHLYTLASTVYLY